MKVIVPFWDALLFYVCVMHYRCIVDNITNNALKNQGF